MSVVDGGIGRHRRIGKADLAGRDGVVSVGESSKGVCSVAVGSGGGRSSAAECNGGSSSTRPGDGAGDGVSGGGGGGNEDDVDPVVHAGGAVDGEYGSAGVGGEPVLSIDAVCQRVQGRGVAAGAGEVSGGDGIVPHGSDVRSDVGGTGGDGNGISEEYLLPSRGALGGKGGACQQCA